MKLVAGNSNRPLAEAIASALGTELTRTSIRRFADSEIFVEILDNVRGEDVFLIQSTSTPTNDNLMELLVCLDALKRASAQRVTAVMPYFGYARQDRKSAPRTPISWARPHTETYGPTISTDWMVTGFTGEDPSPPGLVGAVAMASMVSSPATVCPKMV